MMGRLRVSGPSLADSTGRQLNDHGGGGLPDGETSTITRFVLAAGSIFEPDPDPRPPLTFRAVQRLAQALGWRKRGEQQSWALLCSD